MLCGWIDPTGILVGGNILLSWGVHLKVLFWKVKVLNTGLLHYVVRAFGHQVEVC